MNKLTAEKCREQFEEWYSKIKGTPLSVLMVLRDGDNYRETDGERLDISWHAWQASRDALPILEQQERGEGDWIEWGGGEQPNFIPKLEVKKGDGSTDTGYPDFFEWDHIGDLFDIIAYRIIPERATNQNGEQ